MAKYQFPNDILDKLRCGLCNEYLSCPPVMTYVDSGSVCGRCPELESEKNYKPLQEHSYELIAGLFTFPCRYRLQGCMDTIQMEQVKDHEDSCPFKPYFCPAMPLGSCVWQGAVSELHGHFAVNHQDLLLENTVFELDMINNYKEHYLIPTLGQLFIFRIEFNTDDELFSCSVHCVGETKKAELYQYELSIYKNDSVQNSKVLVVKPVYSDINILERVNYHTFTKETLQDMFEEASNIICKINIFVNTPECLAPIIAENETIACPEQENESIQDQIPYKLLFDIECPVCQEYMIPPIFQCVIGHSICGVCKPQLKECPTCREKIGNIRNYTLEKLTENIEYYCRNRPDGCKFVTSSKNIRNHESECKFKVKKCPLNEVVQCNWAGHFSKLMPHFETDHNDCIQSNPYCSVVLGTEDFEKIRVMFLYNEIFLLSIEYLTEAPKEIAFSVECYGSTIDTKQFMYDIQLIDENNTGIQLTSKNFCYSVDDDINVTDCRRTVFLINDMVKAFILPQNNELKFKCVITKI